MPVYVVFNEQGSKETIFTQVLLSPIVLDFTLLGIAKRILGDNRDKMPLLLVLLDGAAKFAMDLAPLLSMPLTIEYLKLKSHKSQIGERESLRLVGEIPVMEGRHVIILDDICDTGDTFKEATRIALDQGALDVLTCSLLLRQNSKMVPNYYGQLLQHSKWVYGYGMDYGDGQLRHLPFVGYTEE
jgi:hypoxanthine phosphoribosyltransferase